LQRLLWELKSHAGDRAGAYTFNDTLDIFE
jgi:hypothetical protein